jgi:hypothetical protein
VAGQNTFTRHDFAGTGDSEICFKWSSVRGNGFLVIAQKLWDVVALEAGCAPTDIVPSERQMTHTDSAIREFQSGRQ